MYFADSHCHLDLAAFDHDRETVLSDCKRLGIEHVLVPGLSFERMKKLLSLKQEYPQLDICAGFHPYFLNEISQTQWPSQLQSMEKLIEQHRGDIVAIGEFGLDGSLSLAMDFQQRVFSDQLYLAKSLGLPVVLHHRQSHNELIRMIKRHKFAGGGVIHAFSGSKQIAQTYIDLGFYLGIGGTITYPRGKKTREAIRHIPLEHLLLETDAPDMPLFGYQGQRNSPTQLPKVAASLAQLKQADVDDVASITSENYKSLLSSGSMS
jgi:TatD DNase family protein